MSLENDPFDTQPAPLPTPPPEPPQSTGQYTAAYGDPQPAERRVPIAVWAGMGILAMGLCIAVILLLLLLLSGGGGAPAKPTPTAAPPQPIVAANPDVVAAGTQVVLQGVNFRPNDTLMFFCAIQPDPASQSCRLVRPGRMSSGALTGHSPIPPIRAGLRSL